MKTLFNFAAIAALALSMTACNGAAKGSGNAAGASKAADKSETVELKAYSYAVVAENPQETVDKANGSQYTLCKGTAVLPEKVGANDLSALKAKLKEISGLSVSDGKVAPTLPKGYSATSLPDTTKALGEELVDLSVKGVTPTLIVFGADCYSYAPAALNGVSSQRYANYYIPENKVLALSDLITSGSEDAVLKAVQSSLTSRYSNLPPDGVGTMRLPSEFYIDGYDLVFVIGQDVIAPHSEGVLKAPVAAYLISEQLTPLGKKIFNL